MLSARLTASATTNLDGRRALHVVSVPMHVHLSSLLMAPYIMLLLLPCEGGQIDYASFSTLLVFVHKRRVHGSTMVSSMYEAATLTSAPCHLLFVGEQKGATLPH